MDIKYLLFDMYDGEEFLGSFITLEQVALACNKHEMDTDGECVFILYRKSNTTNLYSVDFKQVFVWTYNNNTVNILF
jgi:hypothetical protein